MDIREKIVMALLVIGLADAFYLLLVQTGNAPLYCSTTNLINCQRVESSKYSIIFGIPLAYGGVIWFIIAGAFFLTRRSQKARKAGGLWYALGIGAAAYSLLSQYAVGAVCEYCLLLDVVLISLGVIALLGPLAAAADSQNR